MIHIKTLSIATGTVLASALALLIYLGSGNFAHFDPALFWYAVVSIISTFAVGYRFTVWIQRPASKMYFKRGLQLLFKSRPVSTSTNNTFKKRQIFNPLTLALSLKIYLGQAFIFNRSPYRWIMHLCISGGCTLAFAVTFPLVFGWAHFDISPLSAEIYIMKFFGVEVDQFSIHSIKAFITFNLLNIAAIIVLIGLIMAAYRRMTDKGELATQSFYEDILPLLLIAIVTVTGLALTVSYKFMGGYKHQTMAVIHMFSVFALILYIPFGKLFHMFQRLLHLFVALYKNDGIHSEKATCKCCQNSFASLMHVNDLKTILDQLGFNFRFPNSQTEIHYQEICPPCRRKLLVLNQGKGLGR